MIRRTSFLAVVAVLPAMHSHATQIIVTNTGMQPPTDCTITVTAQNGITVDPLTGNFITQGTFAGTGCPTNQPPVNPSVTQLTATPSAITTVNTAFSLSWNADADHCATTGTTFPTGATVTGGWPITADICGGQTGRSCANATVTNLLANTAGSYHFALKCFNTGNTVSADTFIDVTVNPVNNPPPASCAPAGVALQTTGTVQFASSPSPNAGMNLQDYLYPFSDKYTGGTTPFPGIIGSPPRIVMNKGGFISLKFKAPASGYGLFRVNPSQTTQPFSMTISSCHGDFTKTSACYIDNQSAEVGVMGWSMTPISGFCKLNPGEDYYMNIIAADLDNLTTTNCPASGACNVSLLPSN